MNQPLSYSLTLALCLLFVAPSTPALADRDDVIARLADGGDLSPEQAEVLVKAIDKRMKRAAHSHNPQDHVRLAMAHALKRPAHTQLKDARVSLRLKRGFDDWALEHLFASSAQSGYVCRLGFRLSDNLCQALAVAAEGDAAVAVEPERRPRRGARADADDADATAADESERRSRRPARADADEGDATAAEDPDRRPRRASLADAEISTADTDRPPRALGHVPTARELAADARAQVQEERNARLEQIRTEHDERVARLKEAQHDAAERRREAAEARAQAHRDRLEAIREKHAALIAARAEHLREQREAAREKREAIAEAKAQREQERREAIEQQREAIAAAKAQREQERREALEKKREAIAAEKARREEERLAALEKKRLEEERIEQERQAAIEKKRLERERIEQERQAAIEAERNRIEVEKRKADYEKQRTAYLDRQRQQYDQRRERLAAATAGERAKRGPSSELEAELVGVSNDPARPEPGAQAKRSGGKHAAAASPKGLDMVDDLVGAPEPAKPH